MSKAAAAEDVRDPFENPDEAREVEDVDLPEGEQQEPEQQELTREQRDEAIRKIYAEATRELREKYRDEFNALRLKKAKQRGINWSPEPTQAEKALEQVRKLLADNPELAELVTVKDDASDE